jgi:hypothetical protein
MFITNHVLAGAVIGLVAPRRPAQVALVAVASHFVLDSVPHWGIDDDAKFRKVAIVDGLVGLATMRAVMVAVPRGTRVAVLAGMLGAAFPDTDKPALMFFGRSPFPQVVDRFHSRIQRQAARGIRTELRVALGLVVAVRALSWWRSVSRTTQQAIGGSPVSPGRSEH